MLIYESEQIAILLGAVDSKTIPAEAKGTNIVCPELYEIFLTRTVEVLCSLEFLNFENDLCHRNGTIISNEISNICLHSIGAENVYMCGIASSQNLKGIDGDLPGHICQSK